MIGATPRLMLAGMAVVVALANIPAAQAGRASTAAQGPTVVTMIVGQRSVLRVARAVRANATSLRASGHMCAVAAGTPLAALAAYGKVGGPGLRIKDYGGCSRSNPAFSESLFVYQVGAERSRGADGWVYKVNGRVGSSGAADRSGPFGTGRRLRSADQVLWFWCHRGSRGCQRSLVVRASRTVRPGGSLQVSVLGLDDEARSVPVAGAVVKLGALTAITSPSGAAVLTAPAGPGAYPLTASRPGLVPAFPERVTVQ